MTDLAASNNLIQRYQQVSAEVKSLAAQQPQTVTLLAVSKKHNAHNIETLYQQGQRCFGENYAQEGIDKVQALSHLNIDWHFIGPIQSNKTRAISEHFLWVHTIDRLKIAQRLSDQRPDSLPPLNVLIQVNISNQDSKSGVAISDISELAVRIHQLPNVTLRGLMCIPAPQDDDTLAHEFSTMQQAFSHLQTQYNTVDTLSMGMSGDLQLAITGGSTMVRIGTAIFGPRKA